MTTPAKHTCLIIDDNEIDRLMVELLAKRYEFLDIVGVCASPQEAIELLEKQAIEVVLSDIDMPTINGLALRKKFRDIPICIFITAYPDYAAESFEVEAFDFLVKPLKAERFERSMQRIQSFFELKHKADLFDYSLGANTIYIKDGHQQIKLNLHEILYLEALKDYTRIVTNHKQYSVLASIGLLLQKQAFQSFVRIHRSYAVQRNYIDRIAAQEVVVQNIALPIGRSYKDALINLK